MLDLKLLYQKYCSITQFLFAISHGCNDIFLKASEQTDITGRRKYHSIMVYTVNDRFITIFMAHFFLRGPEHWLPFPHPKSVPKQIIYELLIEIFFILGDLFKVTMRIFKKISTINIK